MKRNKFLFRLKIALSYLLVKLKFLQGLFPQRMRDRLPIGWNDQMFLTAFKSGGQKIYYDYYCQQREPNAYQPKVLVDEKYRLSEEDIRFFYEHGYLGPFTIMSPEEAKSVKDLFIEQIENTESPIYPYSQGAYEILTKDKSQPADERMSNEKIAMRGMNFRDRYLDNPILLNLFKHPALTERCAQLLGPDLLLWRTQFFPKAPKSPGTPFHQASTYLLDNRVESVVNPPDVEDLFQLTCWFALTDATKENGCMTVVSGSSQKIYPIKFEIFDPSKAGNGKGRFGNLQIEIDYPIHSDNIKAIEMKAGQFYIFSERAIHGSLDNQTNQWRWGVNGRVVPTSTRLYSQKMLSEGHSYSIAGVSKIKLDNWRAALIRGEDRFGYNRLLEESTKSQGEIVGVK
ncbi:phytanoyl-CoA dioxygenase family protein [Pleurocapsa sp. PCC 7319]|uniref:phytanoyl-CoA dioxygenase family protein n=1 Tax=Pleurocapsa sp. PCC 7319 TaxID=118161 RepID=UPI00034891A4|nr:phytanoyl-CoA dioxygenase family protein [Pleurocapsa sp. PCC 7319]